jgi:carbon storage regulator
MPVQAKSSLLECRTEQIYRLLLAAFTLANMANEKEGNSMLIIRRTPGESIILGGVIKIHILDFESGRRVKIGIEAPPDVSVVRAEVAEEGYLLPIEPDEKEE